MASQSLKEPARHKLVSKLEPLGLWALVTGASDGIGASTARELGKKGFNVILVARRKNRLDTLAKELSDKYGVDVCTVAVDLGSPHGVQDLLKVLEREGGPAIKDIGVAVLAAGYGTSGALSDVEIAVERDMLRVNCDAVLQLSHVFARSMKHRGAGHIVLFGSIVGFQGSAMTANYAATKAYVQTLAEGLHVELAPYGVTVQSVAPGPIATGFATRAGMAMGQAGTPETVAKAIVRGLGRGGTIRPGFLSKVLGYNMALAPRALRVRLMSKIMAGMAHPATPNDAGHRQA